MPNTELLDGIAGLLQKPNLEPEARRLIEMSLEAQKTGKLPSVAELRVRVVMPTTCGRYHWDDEPVTVWREEGELWGAALHVGIEKVQDIDREFRDENSEQHVVSLEEPWLRVGECYRDDCECHSEGSTPAPGAK